MPTNAVSLHDAHVPGQATVSSAVLLCDVWLLSLAFRFQMTPACQATSGSAQHDANFALGEPSRRQHMIARLNKSQAPLLLGLKAAVEAGDPRNSAYSALCHWEPRAVWHSWTSEDHTSEKPSLFRSALAL
ncbi:uncharacterized protein CC84DRAFT_889318 [Paraphaeosphaeria sporulosa]|uniref:Uncharacterized protein n=1 Tax=Paraphaeosphaeria sporulosa TaxID=1460663 RepID=A0A177C8T0_9PLEO|nr:uncharacterized protein CC84DRAFT_889318 [Paraphaeosphaeria sporulosa]OAG04154.1 hypothetical protein CC84DRAFT_889318 [Paraphaeosphaeria sporulosa]